jgi:hypothetical protein
MPFWNTRRATTAGLTAGSTAHAVDVHLEGIQLFTATGRTEGWIVAVEQRMSDVLNERSSLRICVDPVADSWETYRRDELLAVGPPPTVVASPRRIHRRRHRVLARVGPYSIEGIAHLPPGTPLEAHLVRNRHQFMAMTDALVTSIEDGEAVQALPVVLVNLGAVDELKGLLTLA